MSGFMKTVLKNSRPNRAAFFSRQTISKGYDVKFKRKVSPFFLLHSGVYLPFIAVLSLFFAPLHGSE